MRVAREQREGRREQYRRGGRRSAGCGVAADRGPDGRYGESANLQQTCFVLSMDARHMRALSGTSGNSLDIIRTRFGTLGSCWFYQIDQIIRPLRMPGGIRDTSVPTLEYGV